MICIHRKGGFLFYLLSSHVVTEETLFDQLRGCTNNINEESSGFTKCLYLSFSLEPLLVLIEYVPYGDLLGYLRKSRGLNDTYYKDPDIKPQTSLTSQQLIKFAWQVADGMSYLTSRSVSGSTLRNLKLHSFKAYLETIGLESP